METMAGAAQFDPRTESLIDDLLASGRFSERLDILRHGIELAHAQDQTVDPPLSPAEIAGIERGLADAKAGRLIPIAQVMEDLERRHAAGL